MQDVGAVRTMECRFESARAGRRSCHCPRMGGGLLHRNSQETARVRHRPPASDRGICPSSELRLVARASILQIFIAQGIVRWVGWVGGRPGGSLAGWQAGRLAGRPAGVLSGWLAGWLAHRLGGGGGTCSFFNTNSGVQHRMSICLGQIAEQYSAVIRTKPILLVLGQYQFRHERSSRPVVRE